MALIKCPECNSDISEEATFCPTCGKPLKQQDPVAAQSGQQQEKPKKRHGCLIAFLVIVVIVVGSFAACSISAQLNKPAEKNYIQKNEENNMRVDGVYGCATGTQPPSYYGMSKSKYMKQNKIKSGNVATVYVFATMSADESENLSDPLYQNAGRAGMAGTTGPDATVDDGNSYGDVYNLNKQRLDSVFKKTGYKCATNAGIYLEGGSGDTGKVVFAFDISKNDLKKGEMVNVDYGSFSFCFPLSIMKKMDTPEEIADDIKK